MTPQTSSTAIIALQPPAHPPAREPLQPHPPLGRPLLPSAARPPPQRAPEVRARRPRREDVDERVAEALERQDERLDVVEPEAVAVRVGEGVEPVGARGHPGQQQGAEEEEGDPGVEPGFRVRGAAEGRGPREGAHAEDVGRRGGCPVRVLGRPDFDGHAVGVEAAGFEGPGAGEGRFGVVVVVVVVVAGVEGGLAAGVGGDLDFGRDGAFEGVFVQGVEEPGQVMAVGPDFAKGRRVDDQGE